MEELNHLQVNYRSGEVSLLVTTIRGDQYFCDSRSWTSNPWEIKLQQKIAHLLAFTPSLEQCTKSTPDWTSTKSHGGCKHPHIHILIKTKKPWYGCCMLDLSSTFIGYYTLGIFKLSLCISICRVLSRGCWVMYLIASCSLLVQWGPWAVAGTHDDRPNSTVASSTKVKTPQSVLI